MKFLAIRHFDTFQHYRDRNPPWIKLHRTILTDAAFLQLPEAAQAQLIKLWVLASQLGHPLPNNLRLLAGKIGTTGRSYIPALIDSGFLIPCEDPASANGDRALATGNGSASNLHAKSVSLAPADARSRESSEFRGTEATTKNFTREGEFPDVSPIALTVWANRAIAERWGEQPSPLTPAGAVELHETLVRDDVEAEVIRLSIYRQCRESKRQHPPRGMNYFKPGIADDWQAAQARRAMKDSDETPPPVARTNGSNGHSDQTLRVLDEAIAREKAKASNG